MKNDAMKAMFNIIKVQYLETGKCSSHEEQDVIVCNHVVPVRK